MKIIPVIPDLFWDPDSEQSTVTKTVTKWMWCEKKWFRGGGMKWTPFSKSIMKQVL